MYLEGASDQLEYFTRRACYIVAMKKLNMDTATLSQRAVIVRYRVMQQRNPQKFAQAQKMVAQMRIDLDRKSRILRGHEQEMEKTTP